MQVAFWDAGRGEQDTDALAVGKELRPHLVDIEDEHGVDTTERGGEGRGVVGDDVVGVEADSEALLGDAGDVGVPVQDHVLPKALPLDGHFEVLVEEGKEAGQGHGMARGIFDLDEVLDLEENIIEATWASSSPAHHRVALKVVGLEARHEALSK